MASTTLVDAIGRLGRAVVVGTTNTYTNMGGNLVLRGSGGSMSSGTIFASVTSVTSHLPSTSTSTTKTTTSTTSTNFACRISAASISKQSTKQYTTRTNSQISATRINCFFKPLDKSLVTRIPCRSFTWTPAQSVLVPAIHSQHQSRSGPHLDTYHHSTPFTCLRRGATLLRINSLRTNKPARVSSCRFFSSSSKVSCSAIIPSSIMADRDVLPSTVTPSHYDLSISSLNFKDWSYQGSVAIDVSIAEPVKEIVINSIELKLLTAKVTVNYTKASQIIETTTFNYDEKKQRATLVFADEVPASQKATLQITFQGIMNNHMEGFYRSKYKPVVPAAASVPRDDTFHYMLSTQFEACDARRAFPCFDEPRLKATFDFKIEIPEDQVALSNMPVKDTTKSRDGFVNVSFEQTPVMSTYLLAWAVGDFEYVEAYTERRYNGKQIPVRVYTTRGLKEQGRFALEHAPKTIDLFSESFGIDYPLPKSDLLAVHEFTHGAMENWGLVTYRTTAVLFDEKTSDARYKNRVAYVVAHELAHQWFGNLVTMDWWDELWLNESFATWAGWYAVNEFHPDWQVWAQFVNEGMEMAFKLDGMRASHPVHVPVKDALDVNQIFDHISYLKGCSTLRMLVSQLGEKTFLQGVGTYLRKHAYGNAKTEYLWEALSEASGTDVNGLMSNWIEKIGHPLVTVAEEPGQISIKQNRYLSTGDVKPEEDQTVWWVPISLQGKVGQQDIQRLALTEKSTTIRDIDDEFYKINSNATGFYRTNYPPARLAKLSTQLDRLSNEDKISIIGSAADLAFSGYGTTPALLSFLEGFREETNHLVWAQVLDSIGLVKTIFGDDDAIKRGLEKFSLKLLSDAVKKIGWDFPEGEDYLTGLLRKRLLLSAAANGHPEVIEKAKSLFNSWADKGTPLHPNLRTVAYRTAIKTDPARTVPILKKEWYTGASIDGREVCLASLGHVRDLELITKSILPFNCDLSPPAPPSESVPSGDMHTLGSALSTNSVARPIQWKYIQENWEKLTTKMANPVVLDRFVKLTLQRFTDTKYIAEIDAFFKDKDTSAFDRTLEQVKDAIRGRAAYRERDAENIKEWLGANGYLQ
ncbi:peptidase family M1-domain-containing protein [Hypoxylon trugodes]|uniref:peptidase family M1-domain-containing protein n=1 Tax=Hypoxylon trugodes TaxID=326681 RepID=UPI0021922F75|nr:peptidase family M1-domain-containing protein [Hypoxylon trugodes]KAI1388603.1 peptidase family M1-domain-containing protein [Hypoxylon trugodes]